MRALPHFSHPNLLVSSDTYDDAGVYKITEDIAIIQTLDFFTPMVDDPYLFGQIAAANALSDIYAMGGKPLTAMNIAAFPTCTDKEIFSQVLLGGADKIIEANALLIGGHTIEDNEPKYGLSVCGIAHPDKIITNKGGKDGDLLILTKHIGAGVINTAIKSGIVDEASMRHILEEMAMLNKAGADIMVRSKVHAATDITGFGLLGHLYEMSSAANLSAQLWCNMVPFWQEALDFAEQDLIPGGAYRNMTYLKDKVTFVDEINDSVRALLFDPQTSGGLLMAVDKENAAALEGNLEAAGIEFAIIGALKTGSGIEVKLQ